jgi:hypothetical protein
LPCFENASLIQKIVQIFPFIITDFFRANIFPSLFYSSIYSIPSSIHDKMAANPFAGSYYDKMIEVCLLALMGEIGTPNPNILYISRAVLAF